MEIQYKSVDGRIFKTDTACLEHEKQIEQFELLISSKIGEYLPDELRIGDNNSLNSLPYTVICEEDIEVTDIRRNEKGEVEFYTEGEWRLGKGIDDSFMDD
jgi:hypothetical protein